MNIDRSLAILLYGVLAASTLAGSLDAQRGQAQLIKQRAAKLSKPFLENATWALDYDKARAEAKKQKKWLLTYFTRSYAP
jgi:hypothetical protein